MGVVCATALPLQQQQGDIVYSEESEPHTRCVCGIYIYRRPSFTTTTRVLRGRRSYTHTDTQRVSLAAFITCLGRCFLLCADYALSSESALKSHRRVTRRARGNLKVYGLHMAACARIIYCKRCVCLLACLQLAVYDAL